MTHVRCSFAYPRLPALLCMSLYACIYVNDVTRTSARFARSGYTEFSRISAFCHGFSLIFSKIFRDFIRFSLIFRDFEGLAGLIGSCIEKTRGFVGLIEPLRFSNIFKDFHGFEWIFNACRTTLPDNRRTIVRLLSGKIVRHLSGSCPARPKP